MERERDLGEADEMDTPSTAEDRRVELPPSSFMRRFSESAERPSPFDNKGAREDAAPASRILPSGSLKTTAVVEPADDPPESSGLPQSPGSVPDLDLSKAFLTDLTLKIIHYSGTPSTSQLADRLGLGRPIVEQLLSALSEERLAEVVSQSDLYTGNHRYRLSEKGSQRAAEALERTRYAGPAPVTVEQYSEVIQRQGNWQAPSRRHIKEVVNRLVLSGEVADAVARALYSGKTTLLYGPSGNGKTNIIEQFAENLGGVTPVPYAIYAHGQVIRVFDQTLHRPLEATDPSSPNGIDHPLDRRWAMVRRPAIMLGAELGPESLDLSYDPQAHLYQAPPHIKAQGGLLFVDDFGRQKIDARDLLTRWLISLERGWDSLSLATGERVTLPLKAQFLLATNLDIRKLADDALLRRILYKVEIPNPKPQEFAEIMRRMCHERHILVADGALNHVMECLYGQREQEPHASQARDLADMIVESAAFDGREPVLSRESFDKVFRTFTAHRPETEPAS